MDYPLTTEHAGGDNGRHRAAMKTRRVLNVRILVATFVGLMALWIGGHYWRAYQVQRNAFELTKRADALAGEKKYAEAANYYERYLQLRPDDADARLKCAENFEKSSPRSPRTIELYQHALASPKGGLTPEQRIEAQRHLCELLLNGKLLALADAEIKKLGELEKAALSQKPDQWHEPGLHALVLAAKYRENPMAVSSGSLESAFAEVLPAKNEPAKVYIDPEVYLARYKYRLQKKLLEAKESDGERAYLVAAEEPETKADLDAALKKVADNPDNPGNIEVLLTAGGAAQSLGVAEAANVRGGSPTDLAKARDKANGRYSQAIKYFDQAIKLAPEDPRAYSALGLLFESRGDVEGAIRTWERGVKAIQNETGRFKLNLILVDALIQRERLPEADGKLKSLNEFLAELDPQSRLEPQREVDLRSGQLAFLRGRYYEAINLVADLASGKMLVQGEEITAKPRERFAAWLLMGQANAALAAAFHNAAPQNSDTPPKEATAQQWAIALKNAVDHHWDEAMKPPASQAQEWGLAQDCAKAQKYDDALKHLGLALEEAATNRALVAFEQAALLEPQEVRPHLFAAEACKAIGRREAAVTYYQHALEVVSALKPPPEGQQIAIYDALIGLLDEQKKTAERDLYVGRRKDLMAKTAGLTLQGVNEAIRVGNLQEAIKLAEGGVENHSEDPLAFVALGRAQQANKLSEKAAEAYRKAFQLTKDSPALQADMAEELLASTNSGDVAEAEKALRELAPRYAPACLKLVTYFALRENAAEALAVARLGPKSDPIAHVAMGTAWIANKDNAQAEAEYQEAVRLAPTDNLGPARTLLEFYVDSGKTKLAEETLNKLLASVKTPTALVEVFRGDILTRLGNRRDAKTAYEKAVELAKDDPAVAMKLAEFLLSSRDLADDIEAEKLLRRIMPQYDTARRRLAQVLMSRGGDAEWEEAQKLLEQSAGEPASFLDRIAEARLLMNRRGAQNLEKAAAICLEVRDEAKKSGRPLPGLGLMLAQVREFQGNSDLARKEYRELADQKNPSPAQLANYIAFLLRHGPADEADRRTQQLLKIVPDDQTALELRARWLRDQKREKEIEPLIEGRVNGVLARLDKGNSRQEVVLDQAVGDLYMRLERYEAAERWYRRLQKLGVDAYAPLAMSVAKQGRVGEAIDLCEEADTTDYCEEAGTTDDSARPALTLAAILMAGQTTQHDLEKAEPYIKKAAEKYTDQPTLQTCLASIYALLDRPAQAIETYREILKQHPKNFAAMSDLATVLAEQPDEKSRKEALECVERAIELAGRQPSLLDTKGMALFYDGKLERAETELQAAAQSPNPDPRVCFHYAVVSARLGNLDGARKALRQARDGDLEHQLLTSKDRQLLAELKKLIPQ
jgi:tetratricopeptide (TPR) repeat protein